MAIPARILMLAAYLPLLLPPGVCLCGAGWWGDGPVAQAESAEGIHPTPDRPAPAHHHHHHDDADGGTQHHPSCPAAKSAVDRAHCGGPVPAPVDGPPAVAFALVLPATVVPDRRPPDRPAGPWPSGPPLFLSHCALVI